MASGGPSDIDVGDWIARRKSRVSPAGAMGPMERFRLEPLRDSCLADALGESKPDFS